MFYSEMSDKDMAKELNVTEAAIRRQRFTFMYELVFENEPTTAEQFEYGKKYGEQEVNEILKPIYADYMTIRRYLMDSNGKDTG